MSNGEFLRTAVDHSSAPHAMSRTYAGVSDLSAQPADESLRFRPERFGRAA
jgi:hypothetical protein